MRIGIAGCGNGPLPQVTQSRADKPPVQSAEADPIAALEKLGARVRRNEQGSTVRVYLRGTKITDGALLHVKDLSELQYLRLGPPPSLMWGRRTWGE